MTVHLVTTIGNTDETWTREKIKTWSCIIGQPLEKISFLSSDQVRNSYYIGADGSLRLMLANGMEVALQTEPHLLAGTVNPTVGKRNVTLPIDNGLNLVEWRQRKEQARGQVTVFGRRLRVSDKHGKFWTPRLISPQSHDRKGRGWFVSSAIGRSLQDRELAVHSQ